MTEEGTIWSKIAVEKERQGKIRTKLKASNSGSGPDSNISALSHHSQNVQRPPKSHTKASISPSTPSKSERARLNSSDHGEEEPVTSMNKESPRLSGRRSDHTPKEFVLSPSSVPVLPSCPLASDSKDDSIVRNSSRSAPRTTSLKSPNPGLRSSSSTGIPSATSPSVGSRSGSSHNRSRSSSAERDEGIIQPSTSWPLGSEHSSRNKRDSWPLGSEHSVKSGKSGGSSRHKRDSSAERQEGTSSGIPSSPSWTPSSEHDASLKNSGTRSQHKSPSPSPSRDRETISAKNTPSSSSKNNRNSTTLQTPRQGAKRIDADGNITIIPDLSMAPLESPANSETKSSSLRSSTHGKRQSSVSSSITNETKPNSFSSSDPPTSADTPTSRRRRKKVNPPTTIGEGSLQSMPQLYAAGSNDSIPHEMVIEQDLRDGQGFSHALERGDGEEKEEEDRDAACTQQMRMGVSSDVVGMDSCLRKSSLHSGSQHTATSRPPPDESADSDHVWGSVRYIKPEDIRSREWWVYLVALGLLLASTGGLSMTVLYVFGAVGSVSDEETLVNQLQYLSSDPSVFEDPDSPQSLAISWLANEDESGLDLDDTDRVESRYALAVLYFATSGDNNMWIDELKFLSSLHECEWTSESGSGAGVGCDSEMRVVNVSIPSNNLCDTVPEEVKALVMLTTLDLSYNNLSGTIPSFTFAFLESLHLGMNEFSGSFPHSLSDLSSLTSLNLSGNQLGSTLPTAISALFALETLLLGANDFTGTLPFQIQSLSNLRELNVTANKFEGFIDFIENFPQLEILDVSFNKFGGTIPGVIGDLDRLEVLVFSNNDFQGSLPTLFSNLRSLQILVGDSNGLSGTFPWSSFTDSNQLIQISMSDNILNGELPLDLDRFSTLEVLDFKRNKLQGGIPNSIGGLGNLKYLQLSLNRFTGKLPASLGLLISATKIDVSANSLSSTIPPALGSLRSLQTLELDNNDLFGKVPIELADLESLEKLGLQSNRLEGDIEFLCSKKSLAIISADCGGDLPNVTCSCCSVCLE